MICSGPGTGKSRLLNEFTNLCFEITQEEKDVAIHLNKAQFTFKVNFENGTRSFATMPIDGMIEIGTRMQFQLLGNGLDWQDFSANRINHKRPSEVIHSLLRSQNISPENATIFILVDGIEQLPHRIGKMDSAMKVAMDAITELVNAATYFCIGAIAGTSYTNITDVLSKTAQLRQYLTPQPLNGLDSLFLKKFPKKS